MDIRWLRRLLRRGQLELRFAAHALTEARKDGLTANDVEHTVLDGQVIEDYGERVLLLAFTEEDALPCHVVVEWVFGDHELTVVTAYVPDAGEWERDWKTRRRKRRR